MKKHVLSKPLAGALSAAMVVAMLPQAAFAAEDAGSTGYYLMNIPYSVFYGNLNNEGEVDAVSSATTQKAASCKNVYFAAEPVLEGGTTLSGVVVPVAISDELYAQVKDLVTDAAADYYIGEALTEAPAVSMTLEAYSAEEGYVLSAVDGETKTVSDVEATISTNTTWGDYEIDLQSSLGTGDTYESTNRQTGETVTTEAKGVLSSKVYGAYVTTTDGTEYAMKQSENLWAPTDYYELAWATGVKTEDVHGAPLQYEYYASMEGKTIESITYITSDGILTADLAEDLYVAPHCEESAAAALIDDQTALVDIPESAENPKVTIGTTGRNRTYLVQDAEVVDGKVTLETAPAEDVTYTVTITSDNYAAMTCTLLAGEAQVYALMNVPFESFYAFLNNDVAVDIVSSATTQKAGSCQNVYSSGASIEGGMDINGVVVPVQMTAAELKNYTSITDAGAEGYISGVLEDAAVYLSVNEDGSWTLNGEETTVDDVAAVISSSSSWGDYEIDLSDNTLGLDPSIVYGSYVTATDGTQYAMQQSKNLWNPHSYFEIAWSVGYMTTEPHGGLLTPAHYASMEGKTIASWTFITANGVVTYNFAEGLFVAPHYTDEAALAAIEASFDAADSITVANLPADLEDVTITVGTSGRGRVILASDVTLTDGKAAIDAEKAVAGTTYTVTINSSNYSTISVTVKYPANVTRISGDNRYATAIESAKALKSTLGLEEFSAVVIASGVNFPDALAGSPLAAGVDAPILLVGSNDNNASQAAGTELTLDYIKENLTAGGKVYILGGTSAVSEATADKLQTEGYEVIRLDGTDRYETNLAIIKAMNVAEGTDVVIVRGYTSYKTTADAAKKTNPQGYADSLSVSGVAGANGMPIFLANKNGLTDDQIAALKEINPAHIYVIGGTSAVSDDVYNQAAAAVSTSEIKRIAGDNRYETSVKIAEEFGLSKADSAVVAYGQNFPDGLTGGVLAAKLNAPLILAESGKTEVQKTFLDSSKVANIYVLGGTAVLPDATIDAMN